MTALRTATSRTLTVGEVAHESQVAVSAVRFYERQGLISSSRTSSNQRRFDDSAPCLIRVARVAQRVGLTVREIVALFDGLPEDPTPEDWRQVAVELVIEARRRISALETTLEDLASGRQMCELDADDDGAAIA